MGKNLQRCDPFNYLNCCIVANVGSIQCGKIRSRGVTLCPVMTSLLVTKPSTIAVEEFTRHVCTIHKLVFTDLRTGFLIVGIHFRGTFSAACVNTKSLYKQARFLTKSTDEKYALLINCLGFRAYYSGDC